MAAVRGSANFSPPDDIICWIVATNTNTAFAAALSCVIFPITSLREGWMAEELHQRFVLLNSLVSRSTSHAPPEHKPPMVPGAESLAVIEARHKKNWAIEFFGLHETPDEYQKGDEARIKRGQKDHLDFIWLRDITFHERLPWRYVISLFEFIDQSKRSFSVVDTQKLTGREISGNASERGSRSAHVIARLPVKQYDDGSYRCAIEVAN